jgi:SAM-dependent MidA family methyltransferase
MTFRASLQPPAGTSGVPELLDALRRRIGERGPLPFSEFMRMALYHPRWGYYMRPVNPVGRTEDSDYYTAPSRHPAFGTLLGRQLAECLDRVGRGTSEVVEVGPGSGELLLAALGELGRLRPGADLPRATLVEGNRDRAASQRKLFEKAGFGRTARWLSPAEWERSAGPFRGCVLANEILDAMPVHRLVCLDGRLHEIHVGWENRPVEILGPLSTPRLKAELDRLECLPREGQELEVSLEAIDWVRSVASKVERGYILLMDYGHRAPEIFSPRHQRGTLLAYHRHRASEDYLDRMGLQDLTAHVNFSSIRAAAAEAGCTAKGPVSQGRFLMALGILDTLRPPSEEFDWEELRERQAVQDLFLARGMGESHQILIIASEGMGLDLAGLAPPEQWRAPAHGAAPGGALNADVNLERAGDIRNGAGSPRS